MTLVDIVASVMVLILLLGGAVTLVLYLRRAYDQWIGHLPTQRQLMRRAAQVANARHETETLEQMRSAPTTDEPK